MRAAPMPHRSALLPRLLSFSLPLSLLALLPACHEGSGADRPAQLRLLELEDGAHLRGEQVLHFEVSGKPRVRNVELTLGDVGATRSFTSSAVVWDTKAFSDARHHLRLRVELQDGTSLEAERDVVLDNTPPSLPDAAYSATPGARVQLRAEDNIAVDHLVVSLDPWTKSLKLLPTMPFEWPGGCGVVKMRVEAHDKAGNVAHRFYDVSAVVPDDADCDGHKSLASGGSDCDDRAAWIYPGAPEAPEGYDTNCDGQVASLPGLDSDGDGVLSISDGGADCDDRDPNVHGGHLVLNRRTLTRSGDPVRWSPGEAALNDNEFFPRLFLNSDNTVEEWDPGSPTRLPLEVTSFAVSGTVSYSSAPNLLAFSTGHGVGVMAPGVSGWVPFAGFSTTAMVSKLRLSSDASSLSVVYQMGTEVWLASKRGSLPWRGQRILDVGAPLVEIADFEATETSSRVAFRTATAAWAARQRGDEPFEIFPLGSAELTPIALAYAPSEETAVIAAHDADGGSSIYQTGPAIPGAPRRLAFPQRIARFLAHQRDLYVQFEDGSLQGMKYARYLRLNQRFAPMGPLDTSMPIGFAGDGVVYMRSSQSKRPVADTPGDGKDRNCDDYD